MLGAIIGDIVGSTREWHNIKTEDFEMVPPGSRFTDDTVMTLAVAEWLMTDSKHKPVNPAKRNVLGLKNETCKNREKRNVLKKSHTRHFKATKKQSKTGCFYSF